MHHIPAWGTQIIVLLHHTQKLFTHQPFPLPIIETFFFKDRSILKSSVLNVLPGTECIVNTQKKSGLINIVETNSDCMVWMSTGIVTKTISKQLMYTNLFFHVLRDPLMYNYEAYRVLYI